MPERPWKPNDLAPLPVAPEFEAPATAGTFAPHLTPTESARFDAAAPAWVVAWWGGPLSVVAPVAQALVLADGGGIGSAEAVGAGVLQVQLAAPAGVPSQEAHGAGALRLDLVAAGLPSAETWGGGTLTVGHPIELEDGGGVPTEERWGTASLDVMDLVLAGWGPAVRRTARSHVLTSPRGIASSEAWGRGAIEVVPPWESEAEEELAMALCLGAL